MYAPADHVKGNAAGDGSLEKRVQLRKIVHETTAVNDRK